jgi:hypothetical protein
METGNHNATAISENWYQPEFNTLLYRAAQINATATPFSPQTTNTTAHPTAHHTYWAPYGNTEQCQVVMLG